MSTVYDAWRWCRRDEVRAILGCQGPQHILLDDEVLANVLDPLNDLAITKLTKVVERVAWRKVTCLNVSCLDDRWDRLACAASILPFRFSSFSRLAAFLLGTSLWLARHWCTVDRQFLGIDLTPYVVVDCRDLFRTPSKELSREVLNLLGESGKLLQELGVVFAQIGHNEASRGIQPTLQLVKFIGRHRQT